MPNFDEISQSTAEIKLFPVSETYESEQDQIWGLFDFDEIWYANAEWHAHEES